MEKRGRLRPEVLQLWCWGPDGATTTEERLTLDDAAAVRDALRKEAGGDRAPRRPSAVRAALAALSVRPSIRPPAPAHLSRRVALSAFLCPFQQMSALFAVTVH